MPLVGIGSKRSIQRYAPSGSVFDPLTLFTTGSRVGTWADFTDIATLWQNSARTTPVTAVGQTLQGVTDKSGSGFPWFNYSTGATYRTVNGIGCMSAATGDGDGMTMNYGSNTQGKSAITMAYGFQTAAPSIFQGFAIGSDGTNDVIGITASSPNTTLNYNRRGGNYTTTSNSYPLTQHVVATNDYQAGTWEVWINNVSVANGTFTGGSNSPATNSNLRLYTQSGWQVYAFYGFVLGGSALTSTERDGLWAWGRAKLGI